MSKADIQRLRLCWKQAWYPFKGYRALPNELQVSHIQPENHDQVQCSLPELMDFKLFGKTILVEI